jgi:hypothetical protein
MQSISGWMRQDKRSGHVFLIWRKVLQRMARRIGKHAGKIVLELIIDVEEFELFRGIRKKTFELRLSPDG